MLVIARSAKELRTTTQPWRLEEQRIALVPTMGNLHAGHLSLCHGAKRICDRVVVTIFVNPTQFGEGEDFDSYPRTPEEDLAVLRASGVVDAVLIPDADEVYPHGVSETTHLALPALSNELCGSSRPGHFEGVAGVVLRLLNLTEPDVLVLGEKDYQQLVLMRWLIDDLRINTEVQGMPIQRADDGLALSSRNHYLNQTEREAAPGLYRELTAVAEAIRDGSRDFDELERNASHAVAKHGFRVDYMEVRKAADLSRPDSDAGDQPLIVLGAAWLGSARLIDNVRV